MSARQIEVCAARLPRPARDEFLRLMARAHALGLEAGALRRAAWQLYRNAGGQRRKRDFPSGGQA